MPISLLELAKPSGVHLNMHFSDRQLQVLNLNAMGYSRKEIGFILRLSAKTIDTHFCTLKQKFEVEHPDDVPMMAIIKRVIDPRRLPKREKMVERNQFVFDTLPTQYRNSSTPNDKLCHTSK